MISHPRALVVDDQVLNVTWLERGLKRPDDNLVWKSHPNEPVAYIIKQARLAEGARPEFVLIDYAYNNDQALGASATGLAVAAAAHKHLPDSQIVAYSGQDTRHGRTLFTAALWHWFSCRKILDKASTPSTVELFFSGVNPTTPAVIKQLEANAHLIDLLFYQPSNRLFLSTLHLTRGDQRSIAKIGLRMAPKSITRLIGDLSQVAAAFDHAFKLTPLSEQGALDVGKPRRGASLIAFAAANISFFTDPLLGDVLDYAKPWDRVSRVEAARTCDLLGFPFPQS